MDGWVTICHMGIDIEEYNQSLAFIHIHSFISFMKGIKEDRQIRHVF